MHKVIIDHRERNSGIHKELAKRGLDIELRQLPIGDFLLQSRNSEGKEVTVAIEKKTQSDFISSIIDKRILHQLIALKENYTNPLLVIEGIENIYTMRNFHPNAIRGMLAAIAIDFQVPVIYTMNYRDTASVIEVIARRLEKPPRNISLIKEKKPLALKEQQEFLVESIPLIGPKMAKSLLQKFRSIRNIINASEEELKDVENMGKVKAKKLKEIFESEYKEE